MTERIRVAIVDDHPLFRDGLAETIKAADMLVVGQAGSAEEACSIAARTRPDVLLLDIFIPGGGLEAAHSIQRLATPAKVIIVTASEDEEHVSSAIEAGAMGYILKGVSGQELIRAVEGVHAGTSYITPQLATRLLMQTCGKSLSADKPDLTINETQILDHLAAGLTNEEIAASVSLSIRATKRCITQIFRKLHVRNRVEALLAAQKLNSRPPL